VRGSMEGHVGWVGGVRWGWPDWHVGGVGMLSLWDWRVSGAL